MIRAADGCAASRQLALVLLLRLSLQFEFKLLEELWCGGLPSSMRRQLLSAVRQEEESGLLVPRSATLKGQNEALQKQTNASQGVFVRVEQHANAAAY